MLCEITFKGLSLILVPTLTLLMIAALFFLLRGGRTKDKVFVLCRQIILSGKLLDDGYTSPPTKRMLSLLHRQLRIAAAVCGDLVDDELYELNRVCEKITESYEIINAVLLAKKPQDWGKFRGRVSENINGALETLRDFDLIPKDLDAQVLSVKKLFLGKYKAAKAQAYLAQIEQEQDKTE